MHCSRVRLGNLTSCTRGGLCSSSWKHPNRPQPFPSTHSPRRLPDYAICEYHLEPFIGQRLPTNAVYKLQMPHIVRDVPLVRKHIRVRHGDLHGNTMLPVYQLEKDQFEIDEKYVTIHARHFSGYIVTAESINCCSRSANMLLFELMASNPRDGTLVTLKVYLSSILSKIQDYQRVSRDSNILTRYYEQKTDEDSVEINDNLKMINICDDMRFLFSLYCCHDPR